MYKSSPGQPLVAVLGQHHHDAAMLVAPALVCPMALAIPASLTRIGLTAWMLPHLLAQ